MKNQIVYGSVHFVGSMYHILGKLCRSGSHCCHCLCHYYLSDLSYSVLDEFHRNRYFHKGLCFPFARLERSLLGNQCWNFLILKMGSNLSSCP